LYGSEVCLTGMGTRNSLALQLYCRNLRRNPPHHQTTTISKIK